jgi:hypothetical protein
MPLPFPLTRTTPGAEIHDYQSTPRDIALQPRQAPDLRPAWQ